MDGRAIQAMEPREIDGWYEAPVIGPRVLTAQELTVGTRVVFKGKRVTIKTLTRHGKSPTADVIVNGHRVRFNEAFRPVQVATPKVPVKAPVPLSLPVAKPRPVISVLPDTGLRPDENLTVSVNYSEGVALPLEIGANGARVEKYLRKVRGQVYEFSRVVLPNGDVSYSEIPVTIPES